MCYSFSALYRKYIICYTSFIISLSHIIIIIIIIIIINNIIIAIVIIMTLIMPCIFVIFCSWYFYSQSVSSDLQLLFLYYIPLVLFYNPL